MKWKKGWEPKHYPLAWCNSLLLAVVCEKKWTHKNDTGETISVGIHYLNITFNFLSTLTLSLSASWLNLWRFVIEDTSLKCSLNIASHVHFAFSPQNVPLHAYTCCWGKEFWPLFLSFSSSHPFPLSFCLPVNTGWCDKTSGIRLIDLTRGNVTLQLAVMCEIALKCVSGWFNFT